MAKRKRECCPTCGRAMPKPRGVSAATGLANFLRVVHIVAAWAAESWPHSAPLAHDVDATWRDGRAKLDGANPDAGEGAATFFVRVRGGF